MKEDNVVMTCNDLLSRMVPIATSENDILCEWVISILVAMIFLAP
jgi:hypothetical protein